MEFVVSIYDQEPTTIEKEAEDRRAISSRICERSLEARQAQGSDTPQIGSPG
jgi:hypothetical protein